MIKISDALEEIILGNSLLEHGLEHRLLNLTQLAKFLRPQVEFRTQKEVTSTALLMALSRLQAKYLSPKRAVEKFKFKTLLVYSNLCTQTFAQTNETHEQLAELFKVLAKRNGFFCQSENSREITVTIDNRFMSTLEEMVTAKPRHKNNNVSCVEAQFSDRYFDRPGILHELIYTISLQNVNIIEVSSTYTGFSFFIEKKNMKLVFEVLHDNFLN